jgi:hypothetical protein
VSNAAMWALIVGFISATFVLPVIQQPRWSPGFRAMVTFLYSIVVGLGTVYFTGWPAALNWHQLRPLASVVLLVLVSAIATYKGLAQPTGIAPAIESATSPKPDPPTPPPAPGPDPTTRNTTITDY